MNTDIVIYEDGNIRIAAECGPWGARLNISSIAAPAQTGELLHTEYGADLLTLEKAHEMAEALRKIMPCTVAWCDPGDYTVVPSPARFPSITAGI